VGVGVGVGVCVCVCVCVCMLRVRVRVCVRVRVRVHVCLVLCVASACVTACVRARACVFVCASITVFVSAFKIWDLHSIRHALAKSAVATQSVDTITHRVFVLTSDLQPTMPSVSRVVLGGIICKKNLWMQTPVNS